MIYFVAFLMGVVSSCSALVFNRLAQYEQLGLNKDLLLFNVFGNKTTILIYISGFFIGFNSDFSIWEAIGFIAVSFLGVFSAGFLFRPPKLRTLIGSTSLFVNIASVVFIIYLWIQS